MAGVVLGGKMFEPNCEVIDVMGWAVSDAEVVALGGKMAGGGFGSLQSLHLVSCDSPAFTAFLIVADVLSFVTRDSWGSGVQSSG